MSLVLEIDRCKLSRLITASSKEVLSTLEVRYAHPHDTDMTYTSDDVRLTSGCSFVVPFKQKDLCYLKLSIFAIDKMEIIEYGSCQWDISFLRQLNTLIKQNSGSEFHLDMVLPVVTKGGKTIGKLVSILSVVDIDIQELAVADMDDGNVGSGTTLDSRAEMLPNFRFKSRNRQVDWHGIADLNLRKIVANTDIKKLSTYLSSLSYGGIENDNDVDADPSLLNAIGMQQLSIQYISECADLLKSREQMIKASLETFSHEEDVLDRQIAKMKARIRSGQRESESLDELTATYLSVLETINPVLAEKYTQGQAYAVSVEEAKEQEKALSANQDAVIVERKEEAKAKIASKLHVAKDMYENKVEVSDVKPVHHSPHSPHSPHNSYMEEKQSYALETAISSVESKSASIPIEITGGATEMAVQEKTAASLEASDGGSASAGSIDKVTFFDSQDSRDIVDINKEASPHKTKVDSKEMAVATVTKEQPTTEITTTTTTTTLTEDDFPSPPKKFDWEYNEENKPSKESKSDVVTADKSSTSDWVTATSVHDRKVADSQNTNQSIKSIMSVDSLNMPISSRPNTATSTGNMNVTPMADKDKPPLCAPDSTHNTQSVAVHVPVPSPRYLIAADEDSDSGSSDDDTTAFVWQSQQGSLSSPRTQPRDSLRESEASEVNLKSQASILGESGSTDSSSNNFVQLIDSQDSDMGRSSVNPVDKPVDKSGEKEKAKEENVVEAEIVKAIPTSGADSKVEDFDGNKDTKTVPIVTTGEVIISTDAKTKQGTGAGDTDVIKLEDFDDDFGFDDFGSAPTTTSEAKQDSPAGKNERVADAKSAKAASPVKDSKTVDGESKTVDIVGNESKECNESRDTSNMNEESEDLDASNMSEYSSPGYVMTARNSGGVRSFGDEGKRNSNTITNLDDSDLMSPNSTQQNISQTDGMGFNSPGSDIVLFGAKRDGEREKRGLDGSMRSHVLNYIQSNNSSAVKSSKNGDVSVEKGDTLSDASEDEYADDDFVPYGEESFATDGDDVVLLGTQGISPRVLSQISGSGPFTTSPEALPATSPKEGAHHNTSVEYLKGLLGAKPSDQQEDIPVSKKGADEVDMDSHLLWRKGAARTEYVDKGSALDVLVNSLVLEEAVLERFTTFQVQLYWLGEHSNASDIILQPSRSVQRRSNTLPVHFATHINESTSVNDSLQREIQAEEEALQFYIIVQDGSSGETIGRVGVNLWRMIEDSCDLIRQESSIVSVGENSGTVIGQVLVDVKGFSFLKKCMNHS